jgi:hypothetical protein
MADDASITRDRRDPARPDRRKYPRGGRRAEDKSGQAAANFPAAGVDALLSALGPAAESTRPVSRIPSKS